MDNMGDVWSVWCIYNFMEVIVWFVFMQPANNIALNHEFMNEKE